MTVRKAASKAYYLDGTVLDAALQRLRWLHDEFDGNLLVNSSGGKDSTVVVELAAQVKREKGSGPLTVMFLDQECEYEATINYQRYLAYERDDIDFRWYQIPFKLFNATNHANPWLNVWGEGEEWARDKEPTSIHVNNTGEDHFNALLRGIVRTDFDESWASVDGMRIEESPSRRTLMLNTVGIYKWASWSNNDGLLPRRSKPRGDGLDYRWRFHPIYDWSYRDVWKAIHDHGWRYNEMYDHMYRYGVKPRAMRVSNYHHETALPALKFLQEVEPKTWEAATRRLEGITSYSNIGAERPEKLPYMFDSWEEYLFHLIENLSKDEEVKAAYYDHYRLITKACPHKTTDELAKVQITEVLRSDYTGTTTRNYIMSHGLRKHEQAKYRTEETA